MVIKRREIKIEKNILYSCSIFFLLLGIFLLVKIPKWNYLYKLAGLIIIGLATVSVMKKGSFRFNMLQLSFVLFPFWTLIISFLWKEKFGIFTDRIIVLFFIALLGLCLYQLLSSLQRIEIVLKSLLINAFFLIAYIIYKCGIRTITSSRFLLDGFNSNEVGGELAMVSIVVLYYIKSIGKKYYILYFILVCMVLLTASRTALITCICGFVFYHIDLKDKKRLSKQLMQAFLAFIVILFLIFQIPALYSTIGVRIIEEIILPVIYFFKDQKMEGVLLIHQSSNRLRLQMVINGIKYFFQSPLLGVGIHNFAYLFQQDTGYLLYAHNNYIELAADLGLIGLILYYWPFLVALFQTVHIRKMSPLLRMGQTILICMLIKDVTGVTYYEIFDRLLLIIVLAILHIEKVPERKHGIEVFS